MFEPNTYLSVPEAAKALGVNEETVRRHVRGGRLRAEKIGIQWFIRKEDVELFAKGYDPRTGPTASRGKRS